MSRPFLEIVVPTYNRSHILEHTLRELVAAIQDHRESVALRVIDNSSSDETPVVTSSFIAKGLLTYERNESNIGLIKNIAKCIHSSSAHWVWVFGDDDHILAYALPFLLEALRRLPSDVVFARALCAKVSATGCISHVEFEPRSKSNPIVLHDPGINIAEIGSIHALAFISQLLINPFHWNQNYHDKIYCETDLYTFVLSLLHECRYKRAAQLNIHVVAATDRGDRSYYTPNICIARLTEYTSYEKLVYDFLGSSIARKLLANGRKNLLKLRLVSCLKLIGNRYSYRIKGRDPVSFLLHYDSPYLIDVMVIRAVARLSEIPGATRILRSTYNYFYARSLAKESLGS